ncbi:MAG: oxygen-independent coproporphyrinogen III oxidase [Tyzzerella sp.]|nr:oxygen-independent coproporphyrinogen III oxidase [Tyzzerella sp.]
MKKELELYIHIPFCIRKCAYCDFLSSSQNKQVIDKYVEALLQEIQAHKCSYQYNASCYVTTIFLGGGTPSILEPTHIQQIITALRESFKISKNAEITIEANPGTVTKEKLEAYKQAGINRISFGLQSTNNDELKMLGRIHTYEEFLESYKLAQECGFANVNVDLISAIPKQTLESWEETLKRIIKLNPAHISAYSLIIEEGTPFAEVYGEGKIGEKELPSEEEERAIYKKTEELLEQAGYHRYEISNYAKVDMECKHNLGYWERKNYLGLGLGASSLVDNMRFHNIEDLQFYMEKASDLKAIQCDEEKLSQTAQMEEFVFLGMRKMKGISVQEFEAAFRKSIYDCYGKNIERMKQEELIEEKDGYIRLTKRGIDISNYVFAEILFG